MFDSMLDGYDKADFNKVLLLIFSPEYVEYDKTIPNHEIVDPAKHLLNFDRQLFVVPPK